jgi:hypothetical protein
VLTAGNSCGAGVIEGTGRRLTKLDKPWGELLSGVDGSTHGIRWADPRYAQSQHVHATRRILPSYNLALDFRAGRWYVGVN